MRATTASVGSGFVTIGQGTRIMGSINECVTLDVHGVLEGDAIADVVIVRDGGGIRGNIQARNAEIYGVVEGALNVLQHLDIRSTGNVSGEIAYATVAVESGAQFEGAIQCQHEIYQPPEVPSLELQAASTACADDRQFTSLERVTSDLELSAHH